MKPGTALVMVWAAAASGSKTTRVRWARHPDRSARRPLGRKPQDARAECDFINGFEDWGSGAAKKRSRNGGVGGQSSREARGCAANRFRKPTRAAHAFGTT